MEEGYSTCEKCNGRGILLNTLRNHWIGNNRCMHPGTCKNMLVDICPLCLGHKQILWIDKIIKKIFSPPPDIEETVYLQLKEILKEFKIVMNGDIKGTLSIIF